MMKIWIQREIPRIVHNLSNCLHETFLVKMSHKD